MELIEVDGAMIPHRVVHVEADGSCFFYSLSYLLYCTVSRAPEVRGKVVEHVCNKWYRFELYTMMPCGNNYRSVAEYIQCSFMSLRTTYATPCEIQAVTEIYAYHMVIHRGGNVIR